MKTIAITIDASNLKKVEDIAEQEGKSRSEVIREAVEEYAVRKERLRENEREARIFKRFRKKIEKEAEALVREQAEP